MGLIKLDSLDDNFIFIGNTYNLQEKYSFKIPKWVNNITIAYTTYPSPNGLHSGYTHLTVIPKTFTYIGAPPKSAIKMVTIVIESVEGSTYSNLSIGSSVNTRYQEIFMMTEDTLLFDKEDDDYYYYHMEGFTDSMYDNTIEIIGCS